MNAPLKPKHELFSQRVATGASATAAYRAVYGSVKNADVYGPRLMGNDGIRARIAELQAASATATTLTMQERRERLAVAARSKTVKDGDLVAIVLADARLAGELKSDSVTVKATAVVSGYVITEEQRQKIIALHRAATEAVPPTEGDMQKVLLITETPRARAHARASLCR